MRVDRARHRVFIVISGLLVALFAAGLAVWIAVLFAVGWATPAGAADDPPQITEQVPIRIHGTDTTWPPVLVFLAVVVVGGGIFVCFVFMRRVRDAGRADRSIR